jgi:acyl dehydratase
MSGAPHAGRGDAAETASATGVEQTAEEAVNAGDVRDAGAAGVIAHADALRMLIGAPHRVSAWTTLTQDRIGRFADATDDHQWIHTDPERACRESPFGSAIAHGFLTLSLIPSLLERTVPFRQRLGLNYGLNRVRFPAPVPAGSQVRARFGVSSVEDVSGGGVQVVWDVTVELRPDEAGDDACEVLLKPACVAEFVTRHYF